MTSIPIRSSARSARYCLLLAAAFATGIAACSQGSGEASPQKSASIQRREPARVRTAAAEEREMLRTLSTTTVVESDREIKLFPRAAGVVTELRVEEGDRVEAGAVLAALDRRHTAAVVEETRVALAEAEDNVHKADIQKTEAESRVAAMKLKWEQANRDYERNEKAALVSQQQLDNLRLQRDTAQNDHEAAVLAVERATVDAKASRTTLQKAELSLQRVQLEDSYMQITAPFEGVIASRSIKVGDSVGPAAPAFVLTDASHLRAVFHRPQRELSMFLRAMPEVAGAPASDGKGNGRPAGPLDIRVMAEALPGAVFHGELQLVSPSIDPQSGSFRVTVKLGAPLPSADPNRDTGQARARLLPGMLVRLEIVTERHPGAIAVPKRALRREGEQNLVFVVENGLARRVEVDEGFSDDESVEVVARGGKKIAPGAKIIVIGNRELEEGAEVIEEGSAGETGPAKPVDPLPADLKPADGKSDASKPAKG
jgi:RND family efflux transporter MFP subunit